MTSPQHDQMEHQESAALTVDTKRVARSIFIVCVLAEAAFVLLDYYVNYGRLTEIGALRRMFNITREDGLASLFGTLQTAMVGLTLWLIYISIKSQHGPKWRTVGWLVLAIFFTYMAIDDGAEVHERLGTTLDESTSLDFFPSYAWQILFLPIFGALGLFTLAFLWNELKTRASRVLLLVAISCMVLAVGMDFIEGLDSDHSWNLYTIIAEHYDMESWTMARFKHTGYDTLRHFSKSIEETLEMLAHSVLWGLFLRHLGIAASDLKIRFT